MAVTERKKGVRQTSELNLEECTALWFESKAIYDATAPAAELRGEGYYTAGINAVFNALRPVASFMKARGLEDDYRRYCTAFDRESAARMKIEKRRVVRDG